MNPLKKIPARILRLFALIASIVFVTIYYFQTYYSAHPQHLLDSDLDAVMRMDPVSYEQVKPIIERRCVVCHGCYDAPCQLKLSSAEGLQRGASKERIYEPQRLTTMQPTRLFIDAHTTEKWRSRGFYSVLNEDLGDAENQAESLKSNLENSVLYHLLRLKQQHPQPALDQLPEEVTLGLNREQSCPTLQTIDAFSDKHPLWGMPYAMPNLADTEYKTLVTWLAQGAIAPSLLTPSAKVVPQLADWEIFFNRPSNKQRLVSRYLYEHLFHAHIQFEGSPAREFYRLVRSTTPQGEPINEIPTLRPYDDPGTSPFYYRLLAYQPTIVAKNHIVYSFSKKRMQRYRELFFKPDYTVDQLPTYDTSIASNPFKIFSALPATSRYRFMLDDAHFFIEGFIKGPVCRGQIALDVIEDQFWVLFFDPNQAVITNDAQFIEDASEELQIPAEGGSNLELLRIWTDYWKGQRRYMEKKQAWFKTLGSHDIKHAMTYIWDGDGGNPNAALTVFRHFDSGSVAYGLVGDNPETAWIIDYPLFERIHYLLVAGFDVYGNLGHRLSTRVYMDFLRMEGEDYFLGFLPVQKRKAIRDSWYVGQRSAIDELFSAPQEWLSTEVVNGYQTDDPQKELYSNIKSRISVALQSAKDMNLCGEKCKTITIKKARERVSESMQKISQLRGENLHAFPDVAFVRIRAENSDDDFAYTLVRNKAYKNVTSFLADEHERDRSDIEKDTMTVIPWLEGAYPNFFFSVALSDIEAFADRCATIQTHGDYEKFVGQYGVRRTNPDFWPLADWFQEEAARNKIVLSGLFDLNRYLNR